MGSKDTMYPGATQGLGVEGLVMEQVSQRRAGPEDAALRFALFAAQKVAEFEGIGLVEAQYRPLLEMQYRGRAITYAARYPELEEWIISTQDGTDVGGYLLAKTGEGTRLIDLEILPQWRGRGIATRVLQELEEQSAAAEMVLSLRVAKGNRAARLYARLGFQVVGEDGVSHEMVWQPRLDRGAEGPAKLDRHLRE